MFATLPESRARHPRRVGGTLTSAVVHGTLIAAAVAATLPRPSQATPGPKADTVIFVVPGPAQPRGPTKSSSMGRTTRRVEDWIPGPTIMFPDGPPELLPIDPAGPVIPEDSFVRGGSGKGIPDLAMAGGRGVGGDGVVDALLADRAPRVSGSPAEPRYPATLRGAGIEGRVVLQFVVDTLGRAEPEGVQVVESSHLLFSEAVREVLPRFRFLPGEAGGRKVRTRVMMPFVFAIAL